MGEDKLAQAVNVINLAPAPGSSFATTGQWTISRLAVAGVNLILAITGLVFFFLVLLGGFQYIISGGGGDKQAAGKAQKAITGALAGLLIVFGVYAMIYLAGAFLGVSLVNFVISNV